MKAVILAAGKSTRTYPLTLNKPKPLLKVRDKTILEHNLDLLLGIAEEVIIVVGYKEEQIKKFVGSTYKTIKIRHIEQKTQLGTGHAVLQVENFIDDKFIVLMGDDLYSKEDIQEILRYEYAVLAKEVNNPENFGVYTLDYNNYVKDLVEKPKKFISNLANCGLYLLDKKIFPILKDLKPSIRGEIEVTDAVKELSQKEQVYCVKAKFWIPISNSWNLIEANEKIPVRENIKGVVEELAEVKDSDIEEGTIVLKRSKIHNSIIGKNCEINGEVINSSIDDGCKISGKIHNSIIYNSEIKDSEINYSIVDSSKLEKVNIMAADKKGAIIAYNCHISNTTIHHEVKIWPNKEISNKEVKKDIADGA